MTDDKQQSKFQVPAAGATDRVGLEEAMARVPVAIRNYLMSPEIGRIRQEVYDAHGLADEERQMLLFSELETFFGNIAVDDLPDIVWSRLSWPDDQEERARRLVMDVLGKILLPAQAYLGDVASIIVSLGGELKRYPTQGIEPRTISLDDLTDIVITGSGISSLDPVRHRRMKHIVETRIKGVRDHEESVLQLTKPPKTGGLELDRQTAESVVDLIDVERQLTRVIDRAGNELVPAVTSANKYSPETIRQAYLGPDDEQEALAEALKAAVDFAGKDKDKLIKWLVSQMEPVGGNAVPDKWRVAAGFLAASSFGGLPEAMRDSSEMRGLVLDYVDEMGLVGIQEIWDEDPTAPEVINILGQLVLRGYAGLDEHDSARLMLRAANAIAKRGEQQYKKLAYFNTETGRFSWANPIEIVGA